MKAVRNRAWKYYNEWRKEKTYSPALKKNVRISLQGWYHITGEKGLKKRSLNDAYRRMMLLPLAKKIIKKATTLQDSQVRNGTTFYVLESVETIREKEKSSSRRIKVVLKKDKQGNIIFYSVMDRKKKGGMSHPSAKMRKGRRA